MVKPQHLVVVRVVGKEAPANYVPAAAVIRMARSLSGIIGTEIRPRLLREAAVGNIAQWAQA